MEVRSPSTLITSLPSLTTSTSLSEVAETAEDVPDTPFEQSPRLTQHYQPEAHEGDMGLLDDCLAANTRIRDTDPRKAATAKSDSGRKQQKDHPSRQYYDQREKLPSTSNRPMGASVRAAKSLAADPAASTSVESPTRSRIARLFIRSPSTSKRPSTAPPMTETTPSSSSRIGRIFTSASGGKKQTGKEREQPLAPLPPSSKEKAPAPLSSGQGKSGTEKHFGSVGSSKRNSLPTRSRKLNQHPSVSLPTAQDIFKGDTEGFHLIEGVWVDIPPLRHGRHSPTPRGRHSPAPRGGRHSPHPHPTGRRSPTGRHSPLHIDAATPPPNHPHPHPYFSCDRNLGRVRIAHPPFSFESAVPSTSSSTTSSSAGRPSGDERERLLREKRPSRSVPEPPSQGVFGFASRVPGKSVAISRIPGRAKPVDEFGALPDRRIASDQIGHRDHGVSGGGTVAIIPGKPMADENRKRSATDGYYERWARSSVDRRDPSHSSQPPRPSTAMSRSTHAHVKRGSFAHPQFSFEPIVPPPPLSAGGSTISSHSQVPSTSYSTDGRRNEGPQIKHSHEKHSSLARPPNSFNRHAIKPPPPPPISVPPRGSHMKSPSSRSPGSSHFAQTPGTSSSAGRGGAPIWPAYSPPPSASTSKHQHSASAPAGGMHYVPAAATARQYPVRRAGEDPLSTISSHASSEGTVAVILPSNPNFDASDARAHFTPTVNYNSTNAHRGWAPPVITTTSPTMDDRRDMRADASRYYSSRQATLTTSATMDDSTGLGTVTSTIYPMIVPPRSNPSRIPVRQVFGGMSSEDDDGPRLRYKSAEKGKSPEGIQSSYATFYGELRRTLDQGQLAEFERCMQRYAARSIPLRGQRGLIARVKALVDDALLLTSTSPSIHHDGNDYGRQQRARDLLNRFEELIEEDAF